MKKINENTQLTNTVKIIKKNADTGVKQLKKKHRGEIACMAMFTQKWQGQCR